MARRQDLDDLRQALGDAGLTGLVRAAIDEARGTLLADAAVVAPDDASIAAIVRTKAQALSAARARRVINATGVLLHTNLGRAPLSVRAAEAVRETMSGYCSIELDLETGKRGRRAAYLEDALSALSGSEAAVVVNNCAAALLLLLAAVARGRPVIVSRGELVEIGGGFRVPEVMSESGALLVEVGTTNKTRVDDYARALDRHPTAAAILRVHPGNFRQVGFVERPDLAALGALARERSVGLLKDLGGGALVDLAEAGFPGEPMVVACMRAGANAVTFSTDKVLGGPQGGAVVGDRVILDQVRKHPLFRALRLGRLPLVALEATLDAYATGRAWHEIPALAMARTAPEALTARAEQIATQLAGGGLTAGVVETETEMGGGSLAGRSIPSRGVALTPAEGDSADAFARRLRSAATPVVARVADGRLVFDLRTVDPDDDRALAEAIVSSSRWS